MKYTLQQQKTIQEGKMYLKAIRSINREKIHLLEEYHEDPTPHSPSFQENKGAPLSQLSKMNDYTLKRGFILKKIECIDEILNEFLLKTLLLSTRQRQILDVYMNALTYAQMVDDLENKCLISISTYKRELPEICLSLSSMIDYNNIPSLEKLNAHFQKLIL